MSWDYMEWRPYVSVATKLANAKRYAAKLAKQQKRAPQPVAIAGRAITKTFWGKAWCENLESYSDYANRLDRGARYVRNGSVVDLVIKPCSINAVVAGSETYRVEIEIDPLKKGTWSKIKNECSQTIDSLLDLLAGQFSEGVMKRLTRQKEGLFPSPQEIRMECSCPDWSDCCKHLAAAMYGVGARLDHQPELLFLLRKVDHNELVTQAVDQGNLERELSVNAHSPLLATEDLGAIFGIEIDTGSHGVVTANKLRKKPSAKKRSLKQVNGTQMKRGSKTSAKKSAKKSTRATASKSKSKTTDKPKRGKTPR